MLVLSAFFLSCLGFGALALSMAKHYRDVFGVRVSSARQTILRLSGLAFLGFALVLTLVARGPSIGLVTWVGLLTVALLLVAISLTYAPPNMERFISVRKRYLR